MRWEDKKTHSYTVNSSSFASAEDEKLCKLTKTDSDKFSSGANFKLAAFQIGSTNGLNIQFPSIFSCQHLEDWLGKETSVKCDTAYGATTTAYLCLKMKQICLQRNS